MAGAKAVRKRAAMRIALCPISWQTSARRVRMSMGAMRLETYQLNFLPAATSRCYASICGCFDLDLMHLGGTRGCEI
jgi:hypothetical protein